ncbi:MAG: DUF853 family protein, partial [Treponema sp.]|nr:DUF853 family protein [Treponema sp.]
IKGDLSGTCLPGEMTEKIAGRLTNINIDPNSFATKGFPVVFWDVFGKDGHPIRATVESIGVTIMSRMLGLSEAQEGVLAIAFKVSKDKNMRLVDLKDLRVLLQYIGDNRQDFTMSYGNVAPQTVGSIQRSILALQEQGGDVFFGEPALDINDFLRVNANGFGNVNILECVELFKQPKLYSCFMLWLLTALNNTLPEVGDLPKPKIVFFFDEAHLLFDDMPKYMLTNVIQVVKLIRSKGIGLYFISQTPKDIPDEILAQLGNRTQHTLRAYTPADQKIVKAVASSFRVNPNFDTEEAIMGLGTGEAVISYSNEKGEPNIVEKATILPPQSMMGAIDDSTRLMVMSRSEFRGKYEVAVDNETAYEKITAEVTAKKEEEEARKAEEEKAKLEAQKAKEEAKLEAQKAKEELQKAKLEAQKAKAEEQKKKATAKKKSRLDKAIDSAATSAARSLGTKVVNKVFKNLFK